VARRHDRHAYASHLGDDARPGAGRIDRDRCVDVSLVRNNALYDAVAGSNGPDRSMFQYRRAQFLGCADVGPWRIDRLQIEV
jgi:hypothetical protein